MRASILTIFLASLLILGCSSQTLAIEKTKPPSLPDLGKAPELTNEIWINTTEPLRLSDLKGKVVIIEMWTFACINCKNVIPSLKAWHEQYASKGLVIIGNHYPEFEYESVYENLKQAVEKLEIPYAVAEDNQGETWQAYGTHFWPTLYLIDKNGQIRYEHIGEGHYEETEAAINALLDES
ncbi:MAG: redoxin domain-containing protein [Anaerolineaceae bacterium]